MLQSVGNLVENLAGIVLATAIACTWPAWASPNNHDQEQQSPSAQLVNLNVVVLDSHSQPVADLANGDFQVIDNGKPQKIVFFRHNDSKLQQAAPLGPREFSNRARANVPHATLILFDLLNEHMGARGSAWNELVRYLEHLESSDYLYLYLLTLDGNLYPVHRLPSTEGEVPGLASTPWTRQIKSLLAQAMNAVFRVRPAEIDVDARVRLTYRAVDSLAGQMAAIPGRKNIVWVTPGFTVWALKNGKPHPTYCRSVAKAVEACIQG